MILFRSPDDALLFAWHASRAVAIEGDQSELDVAMLRPALAPVSDDDGETITDDLVPIDPGSARHARAVFRSLGATVTIVDDGDE